MTDSPTPDSPNDQSASDEILQHDDGSAWTASGDDLPDIEMLTPELVEEEAIRGDFMLRGAAVLLAVLFAWGQINDTGVLVHIRSGDYMQSHGFLPPRTDVFSVLNEGQPAANVSWLFDHLISGVWKVGGATGLTLFKALVGGVIAFVLSRISVAGLPTWWSSICGVMALAACSSSLTPTPDVITLLGLTLLLKQLHEMFEGNAAPSWKTAVLIAVWANFDPRAWLGVLALVLFAVGRTIARVPGDTRPGPAPGALWRVTALSVAALLINPFPLASILSVVQTYFVDLALLQELNPLDRATAELLDGRTEYYSLLNADGWGGFEFSYIAALALILCASYMVATSKDRREAPWVVLLAGFAALAIVAVHELAAAALVAAVAAGTAGQRWYQKTFPQEYTTKPSEVLFSRAGRAITVFSFALLGFLAVTDRLPTRTPIGTGFTPDLQTTIDSLTAQFEVLPEDARVLHTRVIQGDLLVWTGHRSFLDSRIRPFGAPDDESSAAARYIKLRADTVVGAGEAGRKALLAAQKQANPNAEIPESEASNPEVDQDQLHQSLQQVGVTHALIRLSPPGAPDYPRLRALGSDAAAWYLLSLESSGALFRYVGNQETPDLSDTLDLVQLAFRDAEEQDLRRFEFAREKGFYDRYLYRSRTSVPEDLRMARHYLSLPPSPATFMLAIRAASRQVAQDSQSADGFYALAMAYRGLASWESQVAAQTGGSWPTHMRYFQTTMAAWQAVTLNPEHDAAWSLMSQVYNERGRIDQALNALDKSLPMLRQRLSGEENGQKAIEQLEQQRDQLQAAVEQVENRLDEALSGELPTEPVQLVAVRHQLAQAAAQAGHVGRSLELLEENADLLSEHAPGLFTSAEMLRGQLYLEAGRLQDGFELFARLTGMAQQQDPEAVARAPWLVPMVYTLVGRGAYQQAGELLSQSIGVLQQAVTGTEHVFPTLVTLPLVAGAETTLVHSVTSDWPMLQLQHRRDMMQSRLAGQVEVRVKQALLELESGNVDAGRLGLQAVVTECGATTWRPLALQYLMFLREDINEYLQKNTLSTWEAFDDSDFQQLDAAPAEDATENEAAPPESADAGDQPLTESPVDAEKSTEARAEQDTPEEPVEAADGDDGESSSEEPASEPEPAAAEDTAQE